MGNSRKKDRTLAIEVEIVRIIEEATRLAPQSEARGIAQGAKDQEVFVSRQHIREQLIGSGHLSSTLESIDRADRNLVDKVIRNLVKHGKLGTTDKGVFLPDPNCSDSDTRTPIGGCE